MKDLLICDIFTSYYNFVQLSGENQVNSAASYQAQIIPFQVFKK